jgi:hypothetical protein
MSFARFVVLTAWNMTRRVTVFELWRHGIFRNSFNDTMSTEGLHTQCNWKGRVNFWHEFHTSKQQQKIHISVCPETINLWVVAESELCRHQQQFSIDVWAGIVGDCLVGRHVSVIPAYRQPLPRFPFTWSARATGRSTTGSQGTNVVRAWWCSVLCDMFSVTPIMADG